MNLQRWHQVGEIYHSALPLLQPERSTFVASVCRSDLALQREVNSLLEADDSSGNFLETAVFELGLKILMDDSSKSFDTSPMTDRPATDTLVGTTVDGRYPIEKKLGQGGVGAVYLARDHKLHDKPVVVKVLLEKSLRDAWVLQKFQQEKEALARVDHPGVVGILDTGDLPDGKPYIVMQYVAGLSLRDVIKGRPEGLDLERAATIIKQAGAALSAVHDKKIYHRDLKPENIMLQALGRGDEQVKIVDFGIAKIKESVIAPSTVTGAATAGTIVYMSPEQLRGERVTAATDIYSLGVIAYELVTGRRPFYPNTIAHLVEMQREGVRAQPGDLRPRLSEEAQRLILQALEFNSDERFKRAQDFGDQLAAALTLENGDSKRKLQGRRATTPQTEDLAETVRQPTPSKPSRDTAHVLFMDIVGYSTLLIEGQTERLKELQEVVRSTQEFQNNQDADRLLRLHTGDGMALSFFGDPEAPVRCAAEISRALRLHPALKLRMGLHSGLVHRVPDINANMNIAGGGINLAQRVMDCGDAGHILVSKSVAEDLRQLSRWTSDLHDLGEAEVKHGVRIHIYNLYDDEIGNPEIPSKLKPSKSKRRSVGFVLVALTALLLAAVVGFRIFFGVSEQRALNYSLIVQKMRDGRPYEQPFESSGQEIFENGYKFRLNVSSLQSGYLYVFNEGADERTGMSFTIIYPTPATNKGSAKLDSNQTMQTNWNTFAGQAGTEEFWIVWSASPVAQLEAGRDAAFRNQEGAITDAGMIRTVKEFLTKTSDPKLETTKDKMKPQTNVRGSGEVLIKLVELEHR
jgi:serine/threonine protein kinase